MAGNETNEKEYTKPNCTILLRNDEQLDELAAHYGTRSAALRAAVQDLHQRRVGDEETVYNELISLVGQSIQKIEKVEQQLSEINKQLKTGRHRGQATNKQDSDPESASDQVPQKAVYTALADNGPLTVAELVKEADRDPEAVQKALEEMNRANIVSTIENKEQTQYKIKQ